MHVNKRAPSPRLYVPQLSAAVENVILRALEKQPEMRYDSATALAEAFSHAVNQERGTSVLPRNEPAEVAIGPPGASSIRSPVHPSPLAAGTAGFVLPPGPPPGADVRPAGNTMARTPAPRRVRGSRRGPFLAVLALLALLVLAIPAGVAVLSHQLAATPTRAPALTGTTGILSPTGQPSPDLTQTAVASASARATAGAQATATAVAGAQATAGAQASATVGPIQTATAGQPAYQDPLDDASSPGTQAAGWDQDSQCLFASDGYHITQPASFPYFKGCREPNNTYGDLALTVEMTLFSGHSGGVFFRLGANLLGNYDGYLFEIDSQGRYKISREQGTSITPLRDWGSGVSLRAGYHVTNRLQVLARGSTFQFYANGQYLATVQNSYFRGGGIGFLATSVSGGSDAEVVYSNLQVYAL
jgi:hypothetical protein